MRVFMGQGRIVRHVVGEGREWGHLDMVRRRRIVRSVPAVRDIGTNRGKETICSFNAFGHGLLDLNLRSVPIHLGRVEYRVSTGEQQARAGQRFTVLTFFRVVSNFQNTTVVDFSPLRTCPLLSCHCWYVAHSAEL